MQARSFTDGVTRVASAVAIAALLLVAGCASPSTSGSTSSEPASASTATAAATASPAATAAPQAATSPTVDAAGAAVSGTMTVGSAKKQIGKIPRPIDTVAAEQARKVLVANHEGSSLTAPWVISMTQDKKGIWWVYVNVTDAEMGAIKAVVTYDGKKWQEKIAGTIIHDSDLPPDVRF